MTIVLRTDDRPEHRRRLAESLNIWGRSVHESAGGKRTILGSRGARGTLLELSLESMPGVARGIPVRKPVEPRSREFWADDSMIDLRGVPLGGPEVPIIADPAHPAGRFDLVVTWAMAAETSAVGQELGASR